MDGELAQRIEQLHRARMPMRRIAAVAGRSVATVSRLLAVLGLSSLKALEPAQLVVRYEREAPGELLHMDTKKLGRIEREGHRINGGRTTRSRGAGWEFAHVAIDDHSRAGFAWMRVPSTLKCSPGSQLLRPAVSTMRLNSSMMASFSIRRSRFLVKTLGIQTASVMAKPTNQRYRGVLGLFHELALRANAEENLQQHRAQRLLWSARPAGLIHAGEQVIHLEQRSLTIARLGRSG